MIFTYKPAGRLRNKYTALAWINKKKNRGIHFLTTPFTILGDDRTYDRVEQSEHGRASAKAGYIFVLGCCRYVHIDDCSDFRIIKKGW